MTDSGDEAPDGAGSSERMALGVALGIPFGVVLSLLLDNWAMVGVGIALGAAFGAIPVKGRRAGDDGDARAEDT